jgi:hypothetical protein
VVYATFDLAQANHVRDLMTEVETAIHSPAEMSFPRYGLEFARARLMPEPGRSAVGRKSYLGVGAAEQTLSLETAASFARLVRSIGECATPKAHETIHCGGCIRNGGWSRSRKRSSALSMNVLMRNISTRKCQAFRPWIEL